MKNPIEFRKEDVKEIMFTPIEIGVDKAKVLQGEIIDCYLASNEPNLPAAIIFRTKTGEIRKLDFFEIKYIHKV